MTGAAVFDATPCSLGEGPLWHPLRQSLLWFDINAQRLYERGSDGPARHWQFPWPVSAAGWVDRDRLLVAGAVSLVLFNLETGAQDTLCALEADNPLTRSNDGRADPQGGFWIGTMGRAKEPGAGAVYRYFRGEVRRLFNGWSIPNAICFAPDGGHAYLADTPTGTVLQQPLDASGWPRGEPQVFLSLPADRYRPDGAVVDAAGNLWVAQYGHGAVAVFAPGGALIARHTIPGCQSTCPAFGGAGLDRLFVTTARQNLPHPADADGLTYVLPVAAQGQAEHRVQL